MKILSAEEVRAWDQYTITHEPISSIDLMERASARCVDWLMEQFPDAASFGIFCGKGNNGGDGLAIARMLIEKNYPVFVHILEFGHLGTADFQTNLARLHQLSFSNIHFIQTEENFHPLPKDQVIIDALFGSGLNRKLEGVTAKLVEQLNNSGNRIVSIDIASGLFVDRSSKGNMAVKPQHTLSFQCYKPAFLFAENEEYTGTVHILDIGLRQDYLNGVDDTFEMLDDTIIHSVDKPRKRFSHKGNFGHALLIAGSYGKMGAAVLAAKACLRSGAGLVSCHVPRCGYTILQTSLPEAMLQVDQHEEKITGIQADLLAHDAIGIGPGLGTAAETKMVLHDLFERYRLPLVLDADALNIIAGQKDMISQVPAGSVLTPHPKEFERLFGQSANDFDRVLLALQKAKELRSVIILKGHHSFIATPDGKGFFNSTGNAGMATAGSGDVLTGMLTALLAQGYSSVEAAILGVYLHGLAGDFAAQKNSMEATIASDIIDNLGSAFLAIR
jgi:hydroxyethylthiazole kinase-like uncharacterized protein yjeF